MIPVMYSRDDVTRRLHGTAAIYEGAVHFVATRPVVNKKTGAPVIPKDEEIFLYPFAFRADERIQYSEEEMKTVNYTDPAVKIKGLIGGYVNFPSYKGASYAYRNPTRTSQLGLHPNNIFTETLGTSKWCFGPQQFYTKEFACTLLNNFPSFEEGLLKMKGDRSYSSFAFGKDYCLTRLDSSVVRLDIRGHGIAISVGNSDNFIPLNKKEFKIYGEELEENGVKIN